MSTAANGDNAEKVRTLSDQACKARAKLTPIEAQIILARRGDERILPYLRKTLDEHPEIWQEYGDLGRQAQRILVEMAGGKDLLLKECVIRHAEALKEDLAGAAPSPLEKVLVERAVACWLRIQYLDALEHQAPAGESIKITEFRMRQQQQAHRHFMETVKMLSTVRKAVPKVVKVEMSREPAPEAKTEGSRGERAVRDDWSIDRAAAPSAMPIAGLGKCNGRSRLSGIAEEVYQTTAGSES